MTIHYARDLESLFEWPPPGMPVTTACGLPSVAPPSWADDRNVSDDLAEVTCEACIVNAASITIRGFDLQLSPDVCIRWSQDGALPDLNSGIRLVLDGGVRE